MDRHSLILTSQQELKALIAEAVNDAVRLHPRTPPLLTKAQVADYLGKSVPTIDRYMREGMPFRKVDGGHPEFYKPDIDRWLNERFREATDAAN